MSSIPLHTRQIARIKRYTVMLSLAWTGIIVLSFSWALYSGLQYTLSAARSEALASFNKDLVYRRWSAMHGGVYVPITDMAQPNPYLDVPNREITTTDGQELTLVNPAYMTRQVHELGQDQYGIRGHITSLNPIRPANAPDAWETDALMAFENGVTVYSSLSDVNGQTVLRYMQPLITEESCMKCHASQGYTVGEIRGGISVVVPMQSYMGAAQHAIIGIAAAHFVLWLAVFATIIVASRRFMASAHREAEATRILSEREEVFRAFIEQSNDAISLVNTEGIIIEWNQAHETLTGTLRSEAIGRPVWEIQTRNANIDDVAVIASAMEQYEQSIRQVLDGSTAPWLDKQTESRLRHRDGSRHDIQTVVFPIETGQGRMLGSVTRDITRSKQIEAALRENETRLRSIMDNMRDVIWSIDLKTYRMTYVNAAIETITGYPPVAYLRDPQLWNSLVHPDDRPEPGYDSMQDILENGSNTWEGRIVRPDGTIRWLLIRNWVVRDDTGTPLRIEGIASDITERKQSQQKSFELALEKERLDLLTSFIKNATHEFRTPLSIINISAHTMSRLDDRERRDEKVAHIQQQVEHMTNLVDMLLLIARLETDQLSMTDTVNLRDILVMLEEGMAVRNGTTPTTRIILPDDLPSLRGNKEFLEIALQQILDNACRFTPPEGTVSVSAERYENHVCVSIADTGPGIAPEALPHIFKTFWRQDEAHSTPGFGLGLSIAQTIIEQHGGRITVESHVGEGTTFRVYLPVETVLMQQQAPVYNYIQR